MRLMRRYVKKAINQPENIPSYFIDKIRRQYVRMNYNNLVLTESELTEVSTHHWTLEDDLEGLGPFSAKNRMPKIKTSDIRYEPNFLFDHPKVFVVENVTLSGPYAAGKTINGKYIEHMLGRPYKHGSLYYPLYRTVYPDCKRAGNTFTTTRNQALETASVVHRQSGSQNFYHWIVDHILKLRAVAEYQEKTGELVTLIVSEHIPSFAIEAIELLGFVDNPIIRWDGSSITVNKLVVSTWPEPTPGNINWLRTNLNYLGPQSSPDSEWIYISRQNADRGRKISNFNEISPILERFDVDIVYLEEIDLATEIELFRSVDGVISPHGAGLTGILWTNSLSVVEIFNGIVKMPFYLIASILEHDYHCLMGKPVKEDSDRRVRDRDFILNPSQLENLLTEIKPL